MKGSHFESHAWARLGWALGPNLRLPSGWTSRKCSTDNFLSPIFLLTLSSYMTDQRGTFTIKNATLCFYMYFLDIFCCFSSKKKCVFIIFISFFDEASSFHNRLYRNRNRWYEIVSGRLCWRQSAKDCFSYLLVLPCFEVVLGLACLKLISMSSNFYFIFIMFEFY